MKREKSPVKLAEMFKAGQPAYNEQWLAKDDTLWYQVNGKAIAVAERVGEEIRTIMPRIYQLDFVHQAESAIRRMHARLLHD